MPVRPQIALPVSESHAGLTVKRTHVRPAYQVLYSFKGGSEDGADPIASLINVNNTLYGTTDSGGGAKCYRHQGCGTVFTITTSGAEAVLHSFTSGGDGANPSAALLDVNGALYGTTFRGGESKGGTVFEIAPSGAETVLYSFKVDSEDGDGPRAGLIYVKGALYGTTSFGGANGRGTVFTIKPSGVEAVLYSFKGVPDGQYPFASLIDVKGTLYGTTSSGGAYSSANWGTVFKITTSGTEATLYDFGSGYDGAIPYAGLINVGGTFYGTTQQGGANEYGTVFSTKPSGTETVLYSFKGGSKDGGFPDAGLIDIKGMLYGTTSEGGAHCSSSGHCGTVFAITPSGKETVLHSFGGSGDGNYPQAGLTNVDDTLYGTTGAGGSNGAGTVFSLSP